MKTVYLIVNPNAGTRQARRFLPEMISVFNRADYLCSVYITGQRGDAVSFVRAHGGEADLIAACGGDGTLNEVVMILEESVLQRRHDDNSPLTCIYPEDGNVMIPSNAMIVAEEKSANANIEACEAVADWLFSDAGQAFIVSGYMHSTLKGFPECPYDSIDTDKLIESDMGVDWERAYHLRDEITAEWNNRVTQ